MFNNAIAWANIRLRGGWKNYALTTGGYAALLGTAFAYFLHLNPTRGAGAMATWNTVLFSIQAMILIFYGCTAIGTAVRRDITNGLLFSHRLMPISPAAAVSGYIIGPALQPMALAAVNLALGTATATMAGLSLQGWLVSNASIVLFVVFLWISVTFAGFLTKNAFGGLFGVVFSSLFNGGFLVNFIPALGVLMTPMVGSFMMVVSRGGGAQTRLTPAFGYSLAAQIAFGAILFRGAIRRYRRDDVPALGTLLAFLLLGAWVVTSVVGVLKWEDFNFAFRGRDIDVATQAIAAVISSMIIALVSVSASAKASTEWLRTAVATGFAPGRRPLPPSLLAVLAAVVIFPLVLGVRPQTMPALKVLWSGTSLLFALHVTVVIAAFLLSISYLLRIMYRVGGKPFLIMAIRIALTWLIPLGIESARKATALPNDKSPALFSRMSPVGELVELWKHPARLSVIGLGVQLCIAAVPGVLFYSTEPKRVPKQARGVVA
jgi:hypothetical protein